MSSPTQTPLSVGEVSPQNHIGLPDNPLHAAIRAGEARIREAARAKAAAQAKANARNPNFVRPSGHTNASYWKWLAVNRDVLAQRRAERDAVRETARAQVQQATEIDFTAAREEANGLTAHIFLDDEIE